MVDGKGVREWLLESGSASMATKSLATAYREDNSIEPPDAALPTEAQRWADAVPIPGEVRDVWCSS